MGRVYYIRKRRTGMVWSVIAFVVIVGSVAQFSEPGAVVVAAAILGLGIWSALLRAGTRKAQEVERGW